MTDNLQKLESELANMRPRNLPAELIERIGAEISTIKNNPWPDRFLIGAMSAGAMAASVIASMLLLDTNAPLPSTDPTNITAQASTIVAFPQSLARADTQWLDDLK